jgi:hypothetical protein
MASSPQNTAVNTAAPVSPGSPPGTPSPRPEKVSEELFQKVVDVPGFVEKDIPKILGKGGFNIKNLVKYSTKKWYETNGVEKEDSEEKVKAPHVKVNVLHDEDDGVHFLLESSCELMVNCAKEATEELVEKLTKPKEKRVHQKKSKDEDKKVSSNPPYQGNDKVLKQFFRVEMDPRMLGKIIGKGGTRVQQMIEYVVSKDFDKGGAKGTKIFVKEQTAPLSDNKCIDLDEFGDGSEKYVLFIATVSTKNLYRTMRNVEKAIEKNINRSSLDVSSYEEESSRDRETAEKMFDEANEEYGGGW